MLNLSQDQLFERWDLIPENLREAILSEANSDFIWKTCGNENVPDEKIYDVAQVVGFVFMGFLHPEDVAQEIKERLNIDSKTANDIEDTINKRLFVPLRGDIDKIYKPLSKMESVPISSGPVMLKDIGPVVNAPSPRPQPQQPKPISIATATATSRTATGSPTINNSAPMPNANIPPTAPKTNRLSDVGWSRSGASADPVIKLDVSPVSRVTAAPTAPSFAQKQQSSTPATQQTSGPVNHSLGEFDRLNAMKKAPGQTTTAPMPTSAAPSTTAPSSDPAPFILHQDTSFKSQEKNNAFTLPKPEANARIQMNLARPPAPVRPAVLEFGQANGQAPTKPVAPTPAPTKAIHYTEFSSPLSSVPTANTGPRTVSEIAPAPAPATRIASIPVPVPPRPPMPPTPPRAPAQPVQSSQQQPQPDQQEKVIVKDFL